MQSRLSVAVSVAVCCDLVHVELKSEELLPEGVLPACAKNYFKQSSSSIMQRKEKSTPGAVTVSDVIGLAKAPQSCEMYRICRLQTAHVTSESPLLKAAMQS